MGEILDIVDVANLLKVKPQTIQQKIARGTFPRGHHIPGMRKNFWHKREIENWFTQQMGIRRPGRPRK